jgi:hypothetical protein
VRRPGQNGRPRLKGQRLPSLARRLEQTHTRWQGCRLPWYGGELRRLQLATGTAVWYHSGKPPVSIRWVLVRDPKGRFESQALLSTDLTLSARQIVLYFVRRWSLETTFQEARLYLGLEGQRQWNDWALARSTPVRLALFSLVALIVQRQPTGQQAFRRSAWYEKQRPTFADALARSASRPLAPVRFLAVRCCDRETKTCARFVRALRGTARLRRLKMDKLELRGCLRSFTSGRSV